MHRTILIAGAMVLVASCANAADPTVDPNGPMGCCSAGFDAKSPQASELVPVRMIPQDERLWNQPKNVQRRAEVCALFQERRETRPWC